MHLFKDHEDRHRCELASVLRILNQLKNESKMPCGWCVVGQSACTSIQFYPVPFWTPAPVLMTIWDLRIRLPSRASHPELSKETPTRIKTADHHSRLSSFNRKSKTLMVRIPSLSWVGFITSLTRTIFLKLSFISRRDAFSRATFSSSDNRYADCK